MNTPFRSGYSLVATVLVTGTMGAVALQAGAQGAATKAPAASIANVVKFGPGLQSGAILARPDTDFVEMPDGRRIKVGDIRRLSGHAQRMQAAAGQHASAALRVKPAATGTPVNNAADLAAALERSSGETVTLPSGRRATVAQIKFVQPYVEKRTGRSLLAATSQRPSLSGPAVKVTAQSDVKSILQRPDSAVLEAPDGTRITVGELKQAFAKGGKPAASR
jgi:hypothetical protein